MSHLRAVPDAIDLFDVTGLSDEQRDLLTLGQVAYAAYYNGDTDWEKWARLLPVFDDLAAAIVAEHERRKS